MAPDLTNRTASSAVPTIVHLPDAFGGWVFEDESGRIRGGGRTLAESEEAARHAVRQHRGGLPGR